jgi:Tfp pilus assembly protein PilN
MPYQPGQGKTAVALFVDGLELKYVQLARKGKKISLRDYKAVSLVKRIEELKAAPPEEAGFGDIASADVFGATAPAETAAEGASNASVLLGLLGEIPPNKYVLSYAIGEPGVSYHEFDTDFGAKGMKLKKRLVQELSATRSSPPAIDAIDTIPKVNGGLLTIVREDGLNLHDLLVELKPFLNNKIPNLNLIDSSDIALLNLVRVSYQFQEDEITVVVYVGHEFTRMFFMQGMEYLHFAPIVSEGFSSANIENTVYSRILLEQDNIALGRIDRILLAGEAHKANLRESLAGQFPSSQVDYIQAPELDLTMFEGSVGEAISEFAIPIVTAWRTLEPKKPGFYDINLIPTAIVEGQKVFKLAWHGWLFALGIIASIVFFTLSINKRNVEIRQAADLLTKRKVEIEDLRALQARITMLNNEIEKLTGATVVYDSLAPGSDRWSRILHYLSNSLEDLNSLWIYKISKETNPPGAFRVLGRSIYRTRIWRLASLFERATLTEVKTTEIRGKTIYEFELLVEKVDKGDKPY